MTENTVPKGHLHPLTRLIRRAEAIFSELGFSVALGPELETEFYNFDALNIPGDHPSRDMQDTFWLKQKQEAFVRPTIHQMDGLGLKQEKSSVVRSTRPVLRTQTSPVQIRYMESHEPPFRIIVPGKVFRNEATDATHEVQFHQLEGLLIDKETSLAELKGTLLYFFRKLFGSDTEIRFRPSYFPFVEPGVEVDVRYKGKWLEVMGAGMVHPNVLTTAGLDSKTWRGFAFGVGLDRLALIYYGIDDVRSLYSGDLRLINQ